MNDYNCALTEKMVEEFLAGTADNAAWEATVRHAAGCAACSKKVEKAERYALLLSQALMGMAANGT